MKTMSKKVFSVIKIEDPLKRYREKSFPIVAHHDTSLNTVIPPFLLRFLPLPKFREFLI